MGKPSINGGFSITMFDYRWMSTRLWAIFQLQMFTTRCFERVHNRWSSQSTLRVGKLSYSFAIIISNSEQTCLILPDITFVHICSILNQFWCLLIVKKGVFFDVWNITPVLGRLQQPFHGAARIHWGTFPWCSTCIDSISIKFNVGSIMFSHRYHVISSSFLLTPLVFHPCPYDRWCILSMCHGSGFRPKINTFDRVIMSYLLMIPYVWHFFEVSPRKPH